MRDPRGGVRWEERWVERVKNASGGNLWKTVRARATDTRQISRLLWSLMTDVFRITGNTRGRGRMTGVGSSRRRRIIWGGCVIRQVGRMQDPIRRIEKGV